MSVIIELVVVYHYVGKLAASMVGTKVYKLSVMDVLFFLIFYSLILGKEAIFSKKSFITFVRLLPKRQSKLHRV